MRRKAAIVVCALLSAGLLSCAKPLPVMAVRVMAEQADLRREARTALRGEEGAPELHLRESVSENIESLTADGTANAYKVQYSLFYRLPPREERLHSTGANCVGERIALFGRSPRPRRCRRPPPH